MRTLTIKITQKVIDGAVRKDSHRCMISDAVKAAIPSAKYIHADLQSIRFSNMAERRRYRYFTPPEAQLALLDFDQGKQVAPFTLTLRSGTVSKTGLAATHPNFVRKKARARRSIKRRIYPKREREFGLRALVK